MLTAATRLREIEESATVAISDLSRRLRAAGVDVIDLSGGDPDFPTPQHIVAAARDAMDEGFTHYVSSRGIPDLLDAIAHKLKTENGLPLDAPGESILVTPSAKFALAATLLALVNPGDEVIVPTPAWVSYDAMIRLAGGIPVHVPLAPDGFRLDAADMRRALTARTRLILVNSPNNPTGRVLAEPELRAIADVARDANLLVISDEIYERIVFDGAVHRSLGTLPGMFERTVTINGFSKTYAMTGWRLGYLAGPPRIVREVLKVHQHVVTCASSFAMRAGVAALRGPRQSADEMVAAYRERRALAVPLLNAMPGIRCPWPEGTFYLFPGFRFRRPLSSTEFASLLLERAHVAVTPGSAFGKAGEGHIRISLTNGRDWLERALERIRRVLADVD